MWVGVGSQDGPQKVTGPSPGGALGGRAAGEAEKGAPGGRGHRHHHSNQHTGASSSVLQPDLYKEPGLLRAEADFGAGAGEKINCLEHAMPEGEEVLER